MSNDCCCGCSPEYPDIITVNKTVIQAGEFEGVWRQEFSTPPTTEAGTQTTLAFQPVSQQNLKMFVNGVLQKYLVDYSRNGKVVTWLKALPDDNPPVIAAVYVVGVGDSSVSTEEQGLSVPVGTTLTSSRLLTSDPPSGFLITDGSAISQTTYAELFAAIGHSYADDAADEAALELAGNFRLPNETDSVFDVDSSALIQVRKIIKY